MQSTNSLPDLNHKHNILWLFLPIIGALILLFIVWCFNLNVRAFYYINHISGFTGTEIWQIFTIFGDGLVSALLLAFWIKKKPQIAWSFLLATIIYLIVLNFLKEYFNFKRPPAVLDPETFYLAGKAYMKRSFPSGHTTTIFALCGVISFYYRSLKIRTIALIAAILVGFSRVLIGVHWPADVFGGAALGWISAGLGIYITQKTTWGYSKIAKYAFSMIFLIAAVVLIAHYETGYSDAVVAQKLLGLTVVSYLVYIYYVKDKILLNYYLFSAEVMQASRD